MTLMKRDDKSRVTGDFRVRIDAPMELRDIASIGRWLVLTIFACGVAAGITWIVVRRPMAEERLEARASQRQPPPRGLRADAGPDGGVDDAKPRKPKETWWDVQVDPDSVADINCADPSMFRHPACRQMERRVGPNPATAPSDVDVDEMQP